MGELFQLDIKTVSHPIVVWPAVAHDRTFLVYLAEPEVSQRHQLLAPDLAQLKVHV